MAQKTVLSDTPKKLIAKYYQVLKAHRIAVDQMILFGSYAIGKQKIWSDVDVCVVSKSFGKNEWKERMLLKRLTDTVDTLIEPHPVHPRDLADIYDPFTSEIRNHGIRII